MLLLDDITDIDIGKNPNKDDVQSMLNTRAWLFFVYSCLKDSQDLMNGLLDPKTTPDQRSYLAGRLDATDRIISRLPKTLVGSGAPPDPAQQQAEKRFRETMKGLFNV